MIIVGLAILTALKIADRLVRPVGRAGRRRRPDRGRRFLRARAGRQDTEDEIQTLASAFNRMAGRLEEQTGCAAERQYAARDAPRVHRGGAVERHGGRHRARYAQRILLVNRSAETLLQKSQEELEGKDLHSVSPELDEFMRGQQSEANVIVAADGVQRTLAVKRVRYQDGSVLTFDDITDQLTDQRRAAWSDIARRIAHEIKNPLTPIQLAAERLQRRFGQEISRTPRRSSG